MHRLARHTLLALHTLALCLFVLLCLRQHYMLQLLAAACQHGLCFSAHAAAAVTAGSSRASPPSCCCRAAGWKSMSVAAQYIVLSTLYLGWPLSIQFHGLTWLLQLQLQLLQLHAG